MPYAIGGLWATKHLAEGGLVVVLAAFAIVALVIYWPRFADWVERRWNSR